LTPTKQWNAGKLAEFGDRRDFDVSNLLDEREEDDENTEQET